MTQIPDQEFDDVDYDDSSIAEADDNLDCGFDGVDHCDQAGSEYCEFECPFREIHEAEA